MATAPERLVSPYGLATCVQCGAQISNRSSNPCAMCSATAWVAQRRALAPKRIDAPGTDDEWQRFATAVGLVPNFGPRCRHSRMCRAVVVRWRAWRRKGRA